MPRSHEAFPSKYVKSADVKAKPFVGTIKLVTQEPVGQDKELKWVIHFEDGRPMVCNRTNFEEIEKAFGDSDDWPGNKVKVYCAPTSFAGKRVDGIRVQPIVPRPAAPDEFNDVLPI